MKSYVLNNAWLFIIIVTCHHHVKMFQNTSEHHCHTVEGENVTFSYRCSGANVVNWWGVHGCAISPNAFSFTESQSSVDCVNTLALTLHNVMVNYSQAFTAYPSTNDLFSAAGIHTTFHLSE